MRLGYLLLVILFSAVLCIGPASAETIELTVSFSQQDLSFAVRDGYDQVFMEGLDLMRKPGRPQLPVQIARVVIPQACVVQRVETLEMDLVDLPGNYDLLPAQPPQILSLSQAEREKISFVEPQEMIYRSRQPFPTQAVRVAGHGYLGGYHLADLQIYPLVYIPAERRLRFCRSIRFRLLTSPGGKEARPVVKRSEKNRVFYEDLVRNMVLNPLEVAFMAPQPARIPSKALPPGDYEYVIVTKSTYADEFQPLADWKGQRGISDTVVTREWIEITYSGDNVQEQIRNFIIDAYQNWGTKWVLLGGDTNVMPSRITYAMTCEAGMYPDEDSIRADLYFSDLDGDWDADGDHIYGEVADSVDLYPDVFVGRASASSQSEAQAWVQKMLLYEKTPQLDHPLRMLFLAEVLWPLPFTDGAVHKNMIDHRSVPARFDPIKKLYETLGNESPDSARHYLNLGQNLVNHDGHCNYQLMSMGTGYLNRADMDTLTNATRPSIMYSIGCWPAAIDRDCIAEHWLCNPNGGGVAFIGNSRYGWGSPGNPGYGYSDLYDSQFYHQLFNGGQIHIGAALAAAKVFYVPKSRQENVYRIHQYQVNLLGDPEMPIWTDTPGTLHVVHPSEIPEGQVTFEITVSDGQSPIESALVCLTSEGGLYWRGPTGINGQVNPQLTVPLADSVRVTVTVQDFLPHLEAIPVIASGPHLARLKYSLDDAAGNGNGELNPGETVDLSITLKNCGSETAYGVSAVLQTSQTLVTIVDSVGTYGDLSPGDTASSDYQVNFSPDCVDGQVFYLDLDIEDQVAGSWGSKLGLVSVEPIVVYAGCGLDDAGDGIPQPGEEVDLNLVLENTGLGRAPDVIARLSALDEYATVLQDSAGFGTIEPESSVVCQSSYRLAIADSCPGHHFLPLRLDVIVGEEYAFVDDLKLAIGARGFSDDMESGQGSWSHGGDNDHWHMTGYRSHSDSTSWYCGQDSTRQYLKNTDAHLVSPEIILGPDSRLTFWTWYDVPIYGSDGLYVVVGRGAQWDTLDYFGSGGALDSLLMGNDWLPDDYDLSIYDTVQVKFIFHSDGDNDIAEGVYIDDVTISGAWMVPSEGVPPDPVANLTLLLVADTALVLSWSPSESEGLEYYVVYRDTLWDFQASAVNSLGVTSDTVYVDEAPGIIGDSERHHYYLVRAVNAAGQKSSASERVGEFDRILQK
jgi:hypothetical protein